MTIIGRSQKCSEMFDVYIGRDVNDLKLTFGEKFLRNVIKR